MIRACATCSRSPRTQPSIIFIDELDAIGRSRQGSVSVTGANDEQRADARTRSHRARRLRGNEAVVGSRRTNRPDVLDPALLRAGASTRVSPSSRPTARPRADPRCPHEGDPARQDRRSRRDRGRNPGMVGAISANLCNEAALLGAPRNHRRSSWRTSRTRSKSSCSVAPRGILLTPADRERTAYHESGHALIGCSRRCRPVRKVSIIPARAALGVTCRPPTATGVATPRGAARRRSSSRSAARSRGSRLRHLHDRRRVRYPAAHGRSRVRWSAAGG